MSFPRYPDYQDSGVEWLGYIPSHWSVVPLKSVVSCNDEVLPESTSEDFEIEYVEISGVDVGKGIVETSTLLFKAAASRARRIVRDGDVLVSTVRTYLRAIAPVRSPASNLIASTGFAVLRPKQIDSAYLGYTCQAEHWISEVIARSVGVSYPAINASDLVSLPIGLPPQIEQIAIAGFLDRETAKIDALVAEQEQLITLLKEKRQAVISHAVTKGLDPSVPMKDSGVEWLGKVPRHWQPRRVKDVTRLESGHTPSKTVPEYWIDCDIPWVSLNDSKFLAANDYITDTAVQINQLGIQNSSARLLPAGSVVFTRDATIGLAAITTREMAVSQHLIAWCPTGVMEPLYLLRVFNAMKDHLDSYTFGATIKTIGMGDVKSLVTPVPPHEEQLAIADYLGKELQMLDQLSDAAVQSIELLKERRSALISAAVTGQIDVRES